MKTKIILLVSLLISLVLAADRQGSSSAQFLKFAKSARYAALGEPASFGSGGLEALSYNPAGVFANSRLDVSAGLSTWLSGSKLLNLGGRVKTKAGDLALGWGSFILGTKDRIDPDGIGGLVVSSEKTISSSMEFKANYSTEFASFLQAGVNIKYFYEKLQQGSIGHAFAVDVGVQADFGFAGLEELCIGVAALNVGTPAAVRMHKAPLPFIFRGGADFTLALNEKHELYFQGTAEKMLDSGFKFSLGTQYRIADLVSLRLAYKIGERLYGFKSGLGVNVRNFGLDYALEFREVGVINHFYFNYILPGAEKTETGEEKAASEDGLPEKK